MAGLTSRDMFFTAPFASDGELVGVGEYRLSDLAPLWLDFARRLLAERGEVFKAALPTPMERISLRFAATGGAALATFHIAGQIVASAAYLRGDDAGAEQELLGTFVESLRGTAAVKQSPPEAEPFGAVFGLIDRPLHVVVPWAAPSVAEADQELVQQIGTHFAGAFLCR